MSFVISYIGLYKGCKNNVKQCFNKTIDRNNIKRNNIIYNDKNKKRIEHKDSKFNFIEKILK